MSAPAGASHIDGGGARPPLLVRVGNVLFRTRDAVFPVTLIALFLIFRPTYPGGERTLDEVLDVVGILVALAGQALRVAVIGFVYIIRGGKNRRVYAEDLVTTGFFAHARNPLYLGNALIYFGLFIVWNNPWVYALGVPLVMFAYTAIVAAEEAYLEGKFGEAYREYCRDVPRWWLRWQGLSASLEGMRFNWRRVVLKEYGSAFYWMAGALALRIFDELAYASFEARRGVIIAHLMGIGVLVVLWGWARFLKKTKRLRE